MSKITFRADDDLVERLEALDASKSEVMREALRSYLEGAAPRNDDSQPQTAQNLDGQGQGAIDDLVRKRVDERLEQRLRELGLGPHFDQAGAHTSHAPTLSDATGDITVSVSLDGTNSPSDNRARVDQAHPRKTTDAAADRAPTPNGTKERPESEADAGSDTDEANRQCTQCGEELDGDHVYCPNCGEKAARRLFCECGDEIRSDWGFCPSCGRRTPAADVLETDGQQF
ncbi:double zinc ribbon domain-containing protein [Natrinema salifodinae]|uniref:Ribbon-helix-helix protein, copG family n=1 Tax=Natrinema salifodinae TaxID=1202768 RepID=A0A1I0PCJ2_9EURY|nr:zinc ribbon domain-containing protein [Natrinema salifodinae]SEW11981.1 Ribbon-helix-helix protein, copG family [Natrinema salifodinae]